MVLQIIKRRPISEHIDLPDSLHPVLTRVLAARQVNNIQQLDYKLQYLLPYSNLLNIEKAVQLLYDSLVNQARILIIADYDADGATSCALAVKALEQMGAKRVHFLVPNREKHGYGLTPEIIELAKEYVLLPDKQQNIADLLITVDNGISSIEGVAAAKSQNMRVLITDHHLPGKSLPEADAIVNPRQAGDKFASKNLCGVGVIFYVMMALRAYLREQNWFINQGIAEINLANFLDLVALGTVADVVPLDYNNRILIEQGLRRIRANHCCYGIQALIEVTKRDQANIVASDLAFYLGPRLNAAGRMDDMSFGIAGLLSDNIKSAKKYAQLLNTFNQERRLEESKMQTNALTMIERLGSIENLPIGLCLLDETWHQGVIGILAARIKDRLHRPVIMFTHDKEDQIRGSARSVQGVHIRDIIEQIATQHPGMVLFFGGHAMAAGLTIPLDQFELFQKLFDQEVRKYLSSDALQGIIYSDGELLAQDFTLELAELLKKFTPWGHDFPEPVFDGKFEILERHLLNNQHLKLKVRSLDGSQTIDVIAFNTVDTDWKDDTKCIYLAYQLDINSFRNIKTVQLIARHVTPIDCEKNS